MSVETKYSAHAWVIDWPALVTAANELEIKLRNTGRPVAATMVIAAYGEFRDRLLLMGKSMAEVGTRELQHQEKDTRVRPDTLGDGGPRLGDFLKSEAIPQDLGPGAIGINDEELLDANVPWWITNEIGNTTLIGRKLFGVFYGGGAAPGPPDDSQFRQHALFAPGAAQDQNGENLAGGATIGRGIPARYFVQKAVSEIERQWLSSLAIIRTEFDLQIQRALATFR